MSPLYAGCAQSFFDSFMPLGKRVPCQNLDRQNLDHQNYSPLSLTLFPKPKPIGLSLRPGFVKTRLGKRAALELAVDSWLVHLVLL